MMDYRLYLVTGRYDYSDEKFLNIIKEACLNGVTVVQLREKEVSTRRFYQLALAVKTICDRYEVPLIINDRLDVCLAVDAAGLHIGDDELPVALCRQLLGPGKIWGVSAKTVDRAQEAQKEGADYLGVGAIYPTTTKVVTKPTSMEDLQDILQKTTLPVVAIGGINEERITDFTQVPISGICMVSEIMQAVDVPSKVRCLREKIEQLTALRK